MGFRVLDNNFNSNGADLVIETDINKKIIKILIQCKLNDTKKVKRFPSLQNLFHEYSSRVDHEKAATAILVLSGYTVGSNELYNLKKNVFIWTDGMINSYEKLVSMIGVESRYQFLSDINLNLNFKDGGSEFESFVVSQNVENEKPNMNFYVFKATPEWLLKTSSVFRRIDRGVQVTGYQRILEKSRLDKLNKFFEREDWALPNALIFCTDLNSYRNGVNFVGNKLNLLNKIGSLWVMDGQHRLYSFSGMSEYFKKQNELVCILFDSKSLGDKAEEKQANVFIDVNMNTKKVNKSLLLELLKDFNLSGVTNRNEHIALNVVSSLSKTPQFRNMISGYSVKGGSISLTTFVTNSAMQKIISINSSKIKNFSDKDNLKEIEKICFKSLHEYFKVVSHVFKNEWSSNDYGLSTDKGIRGLLKLFLVISEKANQTKLTKYSNTILSTLKNSGFDFRIISFRNQYAGEGGANKLLEEWLNSISNLKGFEGYSKKINIPDEEDNNVEFKSSLRWNININIKDPKMEHSVLKTINAFLNTEGGKLYIGVDDERTVIGLKNDFQTLEGRSKNPKDSFRVHLNNLIKESMGPSIPNLLEIKFDNEKGSDFCLVSVRKSLTPVFIRNKEFYYRSLNSSEILEGFDQAEYIKRHWSNI